MTPLSTPLPDKQIVTHQPPSRSCNRTAPYHIFGSSGALHGVVSLKLILRRKHTVSIFRVRQSHALKVEVLGSSETSVMLHQTT